MADIASNYDVIIVGGGPAGATLGARLRRDSDLSVAIFETEPFPRQHIGESLTHLVIPLLEECGALPKVMASQCYVLKYGGYFHWDDTHPWATFFDHRSWEADGHYRWAMHVNRAEFDDILLRHARDTGCAVFNGMTVTGAAPDGEGWSVDLGPERRTRCRILVDASGRERKRGAPAKDNDMLLRHRNVAFWCHVVGGRPAQSLDGDWNIFRGPDVSPIGNFAFEDGWFWYIPVPMDIDGERRLTHSIGLVTHPDTLRRTGKPYNQVDCLLATARSLPLLGELVADARSIYDRPFSAKNYSMIGRDICDYDTGRIAVGDSAFFADPLFSSGVSFAMLDAAAAALVIRTTFDPTVSEAVKREAWADYDECLQELARSYALGIDQWYAAIARDNPGSAHWRGRAEYGTLPLRHQTFQGLINVGLPSDIVRVASKGSGDIRDLGDDGPLMAALEQLADAEPGEDAAVRLRPGVALKDSVTAAGLTTHPGSPDRPNPIAHGPYWDDPAGHAQDVRRSYDELVACERFHFTDGTGEGTVRFVEAKQGGRALYERLAGSWSRYGDVKAGLNRRQKTLLLRLFLADMVEVRA